MTSRLRFGSAYDGKHGIVEGSGFARNYTNLLRAPVVGSVLLRVRNKGALRKILEGGFHDRAKHR